MVPATEFGQGDAETVGNGDERIAATGGVENHSGGGSGWRRLGDNECIKALKGIARMELIS